MYKIFNLIFKSTFTKLLHAVRHLLFKTLSFLQREKVKSKTKCCGKKRATKKFQLKMNATRFFSCKYN